jgi:chromosome partitioning protein
MKNKILAVVHTKGGVGKSTILLQVIIFLLSRGFKIRVADCDPNKVTTFISKRRLKNKKLKSFDSTVITSVAALDAFCASDFDGITVIDTAGVDCALTRRAIELSSLTVTPIAPSTTEFIGFATYKNVVKQLGVNLNKIKMIINQAHPRCAIYKDYSLFKKQLDCPFDFLKTNIIRVSDFDNSLSCGFGVIEIDSQSKASNRIQSVTNELLELLEVCDG